MIEEKRGNFQTIDLVIVSALVCVCTLLLALFFVHTEPGSEFGFRRVLHGETGEPISIPESLVFYGFVGGLAYVLFASILCVIVVEPIVAIYKSIQKPELRNWSEWTEAEVGFRAAFILAAIVILIAGGSLCFGIRAF